MQTAILLYRGEMGYAILEERMHLPIHPSQKLLKADGVYQAREVLITKLGDGRELLTGKIVADGPESISGPGELPDIPCRTYCAGSSRKSPLGSTRT